MNIDPALIALVPQEVKDAAQRYGNARGYPFESVQRAPLLRRLKIAVERANALAMLLVLILPLLLASVAAVLSSVGMDRLGKVFSWLSGKTIDLVCEEH